MPQSRSFCDGVSRRSVLRVGGAGLLGASLQLPELLERSARAGESANRSDDVSVIILFLHGGLSTIDTLDLKPEAPSEFRGEFSPIETTVPGMSVCEHLPRLAKTAHRFSLVRNFTHSNSDHGAADHYMLTGYRPNAAFNPNLKPNNQRPAHGSIIAKQLGPRGGVPPYVCLPALHPSCGPAYLGATCAPFVVEADPNAPNFKVPDLVPPLVINADRLEQRKSLLETVDKFRKSGDVAANSKALQRSKFQEKAFELVSSAATRKAFDLNSESASLKDEYGRTTLGQSCLAARRLVESGVRCVTVDHSNWDTHYGNFHVLKNDLLPQLDAGLSALLGDLDQRGILSKTIVAVFGEFGRTPRVNKDAGRDHWGPANTIFLAGGGIKPGMVVGKTNPLGEKPDGVSHGPEDLSATIFHLLGIDASLEFYTPEGRPVPIVNNGHLIQDVLA